MDKKAKKKIDVLRKRIHKLDQQLAGARSQNDEPDLVKSLEQEIQTAKEDIEKLKSS